MDSGQRQRLINSALIISGTSPRDEVIVSLGLFIECVPPCSECSVMLGSHYIWCAEEEQEFAAGPSLQEDLPGAGTAWLLDSPAVLAQVCISWIPAYASVHRLSSW